MIRKSLYNELFEKDKNEEVIKSYRYHKIFDMITMKGYNDINQILKYKGDYVFVNKEYFNRYLVKKVSKVIFKI